MWWEEIFKLMSTSLAGAFCGPCCRRTAGKVPCRVTLQYMTRLNHQTSQPLLKASFISFVPVAGHLYCGDKKTLIFHRKPPLPPESGRQFRRSGCCKHACAPDLVDLPQSLLILSLALPFPANLGIFVGPDALHMLSCLPFAAKFQPEWN